MAIFVVSERHVYTETMWSEEAVVNACLVYVFSECLRAISVEIERHFFFGLSSFLRRVPT